MHYTQHIYSHIVLYKHLISIAGIHHDNASALILYIAFLFDRSLLFVFNDDLVRFLLYTLV